MNCLVDIYPHILQLKFRKACFSERNTLQRLHYSWYVTCKYVGELEKGLDIHEIILRDFYAVGNYGYLRAAG